MVLTPERRASCNITPPLTPTPYPMLIVAGLTFRVDTSRAVIETPSSGAQVTGKLAVGDRVVIVGTNQATNRSTAGISGKQLLEDRSNEHGGGVVPIGGRGEIHQDDDGRLPLGLIEHEGREPLNGSVVAEQSIDPRDA
jgi:hypothetical protein